MFIRIFHVFENFNFASEFHFRWISTPKQMARRFTSFQIPYWLIGYYSKEWKIKKNKKIKKTNKPYYFKTFQHHLIEKKFISHISFWNRKPFSIEWQTDNNIFWISFLNPLHSFWNCEKPNTQFLELCITEKSRSIL